MADGKNGRMHMLKLLLTLIFSISILSSVSLAKTDDSKLQKEYGVNLTRVPFFLRYMFNSHYGKDWKNSDFSERKAFLADYDNRTAEEQAQEQADVKAEIDKAKQDLADKKEKARQERDRKRAQLAEERSEQMEEAQRQKEFEQAVHDQQKELQQMQQESVQRN